MQSQDRFSVVELLMQALTAGALVLMVAVFAVYFTRMAARIPDLRAERYLEEARRHLEEAAELQWIRYLHEEGFAGSVDELRLPRVDGIVLSIEASGTSWSGTASHTALGSDRGCAIFLGAASVPTSPIRPQQPGRVACTD